MAEQTAELVRQARAGNAGAFEQLIELYEDAALSVAYAQLGEANLAGDAVQEGFIKAWRQLGTLEDEGRFGAWLMQIVRHAATDVYRRQRTVQGTDVLGRVADERPGPEGVQVVEDERERVRRALGALDELTRMVMVLRYFEERPSKEIADILQMSPAAVDMRLSRGRTQLRALLEKGEGERLMNEAKDYG